MPDILAAVQVHHFLLLGGLLFSCGLVTILTRRNAIGILMGVELILNGANVNLAAFNRFSHGATESGQALFSGQVFALFVIVLAAAEAAVALAIFLNYYNNQSTIDVEKGTRLRG